MLFTGAQKPPKVNPRWQNFRRQGARSSGKRWSLGLVAQTLLVAIRLHALTALMLADLCLTDFFQVTHGLVFSEELENDFVERIFDDAFST